jgi:hypothetical protein
VHGPGMRDLEIIDLRLVADDQIKRGVGLG